jgi:hypothetical protein
MAKAIEILSLTQTSDGQFVASGTCDGAAFNAATITYRGEPIFKVREANPEGVVETLRMTESKFDRGARIAIARALKAARLRQQRLDATALARSTVKELRQLCKEEGLKGYHVKGVRKEDLVAKLLAAA